MHTIFMKKSLKVFLLLIFVLLISVVASLIYAIFITAPYNLQKEKLINVNRQVIFLDKNGIEFSEKSNGIEIAKFEELPKNLVNAFIATEDKRFYKHNGIDYKGLFRALVNNLKTFSFKEGGSTITQQLVKNTHLTNEKTIKRKLIEFKLSNEIEKHYSKNEILEIYLNTIYFGEGCYGVSSASKHYFNKNVSELTLPECALLAGMVKAPSHYSPFYNSDKAFARMKTVLNLLNNQGYISKEELNVASKELLKLNSNFNSKYDYSYLAYKEASGFIDKYPYYSNKFYVYTNYDKKINDFLTEIYAETDTNCDKTLVIQEPNGSVIGYCSSCGNINRQPGSTIKPLLVYAPCIQEGIVDSCSFIDDEKINVNGYSPKNYNDKYLGKISVKESLAKSSNVCAVKLLNQIGVEKAKNYLSKTNLNLSKEENNLALALGATKYGTNLVNLTASYNIFVNDGLYYVPHTVNKIITENNEIIYYNKNASTKIFNNDTSEIVREMLANTVKNGTAKGLKNDNFDLYAKTGTVGTKNGNTDAYTISFNKEYIMGVWFGNYDYSLLSNSITGGGLPCKSSRYLWEKIYYDKSAPDSFKVNHAKKINIDKDVYESERKILLADDISPKECLQEELFTKNRVLNSKSTRFHSPIIEKPKITVNNNRIQIELCLTKYINAYVFRCEKGRKDKLVFDTKVNKQLTFYDYNIKDNSIYSYYVIPYYIYNGKEYKGNKIYLDKIKTPINNIGENWWLN